MKFGNGAEHFAKPELQGWVMNYAIERFIRISILTDTCEKSGVRTDARPLRVIAWMTRQSEKIIL